MTALGAAIYVGFFVLAALWLFITGDHVHRPKRSKAVSVSSAVDRSMPWPATQSSSK